MRFSLAAGWAAALLLTACGERPADTADIGGAERAAIGVALMEDFGTIDMPAWFREAGVPIRAINAAQPNPTRIETNRKYADFDAVLMDGVGHYLHMSRPEEFNPLLLEAIAELADGLQ